MRAIFGLALSGFVLSAVAQNEQARTNAAGWSEAELLKEVKTPAGFEATIFAAPPMANYPVFVAASVDGMVFVSSDGNGSLGRDPNRGRVLRLRDLDGDGRADEVKEFVKSVDSPRGLVWDHDRLYSLHPPNISEFVDKDGDGVADESRVLVKGIGWTFKDRPADHGSNGLELGIDGWLYAAIGDFGFMEATGTDGRKLQLRAGGVVRVRPDGTGLHVYSRGTRNIVEAAVGPTLDVFSRDNTNDGGGWDVRLHHNTGLANHGYPSLYKNFSDELIQPLADYGGGSGCGAAWIDEPGIPAEWNNAPFTCDWGRGWVYRHGLTPKGATFSADQKQFVGLTRPTDLDVDGNSRIYVASWKGAQYNWAGPQVGYIVQLRPKDFKPEAMPEFAKVNAQSLTALLSDKSHRRRLEAQRALLRKDLVGSTGLKLKEIAVGEGYIDAPKGPIDLKEGRVAAIFTARLGGNTNLGSYASDESMREYVIRALGEPDHKVSESEARVIRSGLKSSSARVRLQAIIAAGFQNLTVSSSELVDRTADSDPVVAHTAIEALKKMQATEACWPLVDSAGAQRVGVLKVLQGIHTVAAVDGLTERLQREKDATRRVGLFTALARLHFREGVWKGDSWGTRPDTTGPYYQAETWSESPRILRALNDAVEKASGEELAAYAVELNRHKVQSDVALAKVVAAAEKDEKLLEAAMGLIGRAEKVPASAEGLLIKAAGDAKISEAARGQAVVALAKAPSAEGIKAGLAGLQRLSAESSRQARNQFLNSAALENQLPLLQAEAEAGNIYAEAAILGIGDRRNAKEENREAAKAYFNKAWSDPKRKPQILKALAFLERPIYREQIMAAMEDSDQAVASAARETARVLRLDRRRAPNANAPKIESMNVADAIARVVNTKGDVETGKRLFTQLTCANCHTVSEKEPQRGPYLGNIAATFKRPELAEAILVPNKTLAQGFVANRFELKDGEDVEGFVTQEAADKVTIRDVTAREISLDVKNIVRRQKLEKSLMPEGLAAGITVQELAGLLDYLESLNVKAQ